MIFMMSEGKVVYDIRGKGSVVFNSTCIVLGKVAGNSPVHIVAIVQKKYNS